MVRMGCCLLQAEHWSRTRRATEAGAWRFEGKRGKNLGKKSVKVSHLCPSTKASAPFSFYLHAFTTYFATSNSMVLVGTLARPKTWGWSSRQQLSKAFKHLQHADYRLCSLPVLDCPLQSGLAVYQCHLPHRGCSSKRNCAMTE